MQIDKRILEAHQKTQALLAIADELRSEGISLRLGTVGGADITLSDKDAILIAEIR